MNTLRPCERTFFEKARNTIMKKIIESLSFSGSCKECDSVFLSKDDREFFFQFVLS